MKKRNGIAIAVGVVAITAISLAGCGSDSPTNPGGGGNPGGGSQIAAGSFSMQLQQWTCGMTDTMSTSLSGIQCSTFSFDELFELTCPVTITGNSFTIDCTTNETDFGCSWTERIQATGTLAGDTWTVVGTVTTSNENPPGCTGQPACIGVRVVVTRTGDAPTACTYADVNTVGATVTGGPFAGTTEFQAGGFSSGGGGIYSWSIFGGASSKAGIGAPDVLQNVANLSLDLADIDASALPATFALTVSGGEGVQALPTGSAYYSDQTTAGAFFVSTGGTGQITVNEVTDTYIAGRINSLTIQGDQYPAGGGNPTAATRSLTGGFFVQADQFPTATVSGWLQRVQRNWAPAAEE